MRKNTIISLILNMLRDMSLIKWLAKCINLVLLIIVIHEKNSWM